MHLGASISSVNNDGENVFHIACRSFPHFETKVMLLTKRIVIFFIRYGRLQIVQRILKMEQSNSVINEGDGKGLTALHIAAEFGLSLFLLSQELTFIFTFVTLLNLGHVRVVQSLIKKGALLHRDHAGIYIDLFIPLICVNNKINTLQKQKIEFIIILGQSPLHKSSAKGHKETMKLIMNVHSQLLDQTDKDGV